ncbi:hypothetical protein RHGRI_018127 [Rhododendron griersonianum]|uniref:Uncharacterized protein n=1 Tax=Rhododendron griersonianum TaxID=479676 RepID=A0AAV6K0D6_9ERIC|nr:hypothetical protein RHGRI_018127 [Rhododendron griersonianum]
MKQRIVIKEAIKGQKSRSKALNIVGGVAGVGSVAFAGLYNNHIVVTGDGVDAVELTKLLRKKVGSSELVSVGSVDRVRRQWLWQCADSGRGLEIDWESPPKFDEYPDEEEVVIHEVVENVKDEPMKEIIAEENIVPVAGKITRAEPMQKVVIKLPLNGKRSSCKAMQIAVGVPGVASAALAGEDKNQIEVTGDGIDVAALTMLLRKNVGFAELVSVAPVSEDNKSGDDQSESEKEVAVLQIPWYYNYPYGYGPGHMYVIRDQNPASCSIM